MPPRPSATQIRMNSITKCLATTVTSLEVLANGFNEPSLEVISYTTRSLLEKLELAQTVKQNKNDCIQLLEQTQELLNVILITHVKSDTGADLPPTVLKNIRKFTETLHKIHTFIETQQQGSKIKRLFRQGELGTLLKNCKEGLQQGLEFFQIDMRRMMRDIADIQKESEQHHEEVLRLIETLSDTVSDGASTISRVYSGSHTNSSTSITMLPSEAKIFHGRDSELCEIFRLFSQGTPRIAVLGPGGIGKTTFARVILHHTQIITKYDQHRHFVACDSATTRMELAALIGAHLGLKAGKDLTRAVVQHLSRSPPSLLILDNVETAWEPLQSRNEVEQFLSLLTDVTHLALMVTMRGAERLGKVAWTHPFLPPLRPLEQDAARQTFLDIADDIHNLEDVDKVLALTDNMPLAIDLLAHLVDAEGCSAVLSRWEEGKTSVISNGCDRKSNLNLSISLSLTSPRLKTFAHAQNLLSLLSILPNGLSDVELVQSKLPIDNILGCKAALIGTSLAYTDTNKRLKALVPIKEYVRKIQPATDVLVRPLRQYFQQLLELLQEYAGTVSASSTVARISSNLANIQNVLQKGLQQGHPDLVDSIYCTCYLSRFSSLTGQGAIPLMVQIQNILPLACDHRLEAYFATEMLNLRPILNPDTVISQALTHIGQCNDLDLKSGNTKRHAQGLTRMAWVHWYLGHYSAAQTCAKESQRLARIAADLYGEARGLRIEATCWYSLGNYNQSLSLCDRAQQLLASCGMFHSQVNHGIMTLQAEVHKVKSEYIEARNIDQHILQETSVTQDPYAHGFALLNVAEIDVAMHVPKEDVKRNIDSARTIFSTITNRRGLTWCDNILADLSLREGNMLAAKTLFLRCLTASWEENEFVSFCLECLGDASCWTLTSETSSWTTVLFVHALKLKKKLLIHKAFLSLGQIFYDKADNDTAMSLFNVALEGFTQMDVHRSRAECMLHLGDTYLRSGNLLKAVELWDTARPLFERSSGSRQVTKIDERLALVSEDLLEHHQKELCISCTFRDPRESEG
ncbi:hypothetical protein DFH06DRAFT_1424833 [Mycena polygramma]|nr:hypothetical protein DFH06DRAFT_1424833 [Mycena polygramma]